MTPSELDLTMATRALGTALAIGLFVGLERGWREREVREGGRVAGLRTFALIGLMGGALSLVASQAGVSPAALLAVGLASVAALFAVAFRRAAADAGTVSITAPSQPSSPSPSAPWRPRARRWSPWPPPWWSPCSWG